MIVTLIRVRLLLMTYKPFNFLCDAQYIYLCVSAFPEFLWYFIMSYFCWLIAYLFKFAIQLNEIIVYVLLNMIFLRNNPVNKKIIQVDSSMSSFVLMKTKKRMSGQIQKTMMIASHKKKQNYFQLIIDLGKYVYKLKIFNLSDNLVSH